METINKIKNYKLIFFALVLIELLTLYAIFFLKIEYFQQFRDLLIVSFALPSIIATGAIMAKIFVCPECKTKLISRDAFTLFDEKCEKCHCDFK